MALFTRHRFPDVMDVMDRVETPPIDHDVLIDQVHAVYAAQGAVVDRAAIAQAVAAHLREDGAVAVPPRRRRARRTGWVQELVLGGMLVAIVAGLALAFRPLPTAHLAPWPPAPVVIYGPTVGPNHRAGAGDDTQAGCRLSLKVLALTQPGKHLAVNGHGPTCDRGANRVTILP